jgi:hypothetical protein
MGHKAEFLGICWVVKVEDPFKVCLETFFKFDRFVVVGSKKLVCLELTKSM